MGTNWICTTTQKVQSDIRILVERKVLRLELQFLKGCTDNADKFADKLGAPLSTPWYHWGYMVREGGLEPETPPSQTLQLQGLGSTTPNSSAFLYTFSHTTS